MVLDIVRFATELVDVSDLAFPKSDTVRAEELAMAEQLIKSLAGPFEPGKYTDDYRANLMKIIRAKTKGKKKVELDEPSEAPADAQVIDLMARLRASLEEGRDTRRVPAEGGRMGAVRAGRKRAAAVERKPARSRRRRTA